MIPKIVPPLIGLGVLVTRPAGQAQTLYAEIERLGGTAHKFPTIAIEPLAAAAAAPCDLVVFASVNASRTWQAARRAQPGNEGCGDRQGDRQRA